MPKKEPSVSRAAQKAQTRSRIIEAAFQALLEEGPEGFSMHKVARRAGIAQPSFYVHFEDTGQLFAAMVQEVSVRYITPLQDMLVEAATTRSDTEMRVVVTRVLEASFAFVAGNKALCRMLWTERGRPHSVLGARLQDAYECNRQGWLKSFGRMGLPITRKKERAKALMFFDGMSALFETLALQWAEGVYAGADHPSAILADWVMLFWQDELNSRLKTGH